MAANLDSPFPALAGEIRKPGMAAGVICATARWAKQVI